MKIEVGGVVSWPVVCSTGEANKALSCDPRFGTALASRELVCWACPPAFGPRPTSAWEVPPTSHVVNRHRSYAKSKSMSSASDWNIMKTDNRLHQLCALMDRIKHLIPD